MKLFTIKKTLPCAVVLALSACVSIPEDNGALPQRDMARAQLAQSIRLTRDGWPPALWWTGYHDAQLNALITQALKDSPNMQSANARFATARAALQLSQSEEGFKVDANANVTRQRYSANGFFPPPLGGAYFTEITPQIVASYNFDWWGKHKAAIGAALGEVNARLAENAEAEQTVVAGVAQSYFILQGEWARLANLRQIESLQTELVADKVKRIAHGVAASDSERSAEIELDNTRLQITRLETQIARERESLRALVGADASGLKDLVARPLPATTPALPGKLGMDLLARRPDLQAARWRVEASLERVDATKASFYPDINLSAAIGSDVISFEDLLKYPSRTLLIGSTFNLPLFDSGRLQARLAGSRSQRNEMIADYNLAVVTAVREIAQEGVSLQGVQKQIAQQEAVTNVSKALLQGAQARYKQGLADHSSLLTASLAVQRQTDAELQLQSQQIQNEIALVKALGGGYVVPNSAPEAQTTVSQK